MTFAIQKPDTKLSGIQINRGIGAPEFLAVPGLINPTHKNMSYENKSVKIRW